MTHPDPKSPRRVRVGRTARLLTVLIPAAVTVAVLGGGSASATTAGAADTSAVAPMASGPAAGSVADPDMLQGPDGNYYTYSTKAASGCGDGSTYWVPLRITASADISGACATKDALPGGPGSWAFGGCNAAVWAPSVAKIGGRWILFYAASKAGSGADCDSRGHICIGKAYASSPAGPFRDAGEFACPADGRWALDPDAFVTGGKAYVVYRDDAVTSGAETGISAVQVDSDGVGIWSTRRTMLTSASVTWETKGTSGGTHVVENPSMALVNGKWRVFFSGNNWDSVRYATGIATCGTSPLTACSISNSTTVPYYGYSGSGGLSPYRTLPGNNTGPGGMDLYVDNAGVTRVIWHYWPSGARKAVTGVLNSDFTIS